MPRKASLLLIGLAAAPYLLIAAGQQGKPTYAQDVLPVLKAHCASCHTGASASASFDVTSIDSVKKRITPKDSKNSVLVQRLRGIGGDQMPMGFAALPAETIDRIAAWIDAGATFETGPVTHWAYVKPVKPKVPAIAAKNPIDAFVRARLQKEGLKPSPEASKEVLLRRVYLDLIGLPPTPKQIDAFLADKRPDAYERVVDALLKNPHYGERQAEPWLDLSRYADSDGYEKDLQRTAWKYRDWLIDAFNRNLPYDRFTIEQLAGDLLPSPTLDQLVATGFNRNTMFNREGGVDQEEAHFNVILDRVNTTATVWLGSTLQCARCHDHKYDPFTQRDYYKMSAFFSNSVILPRGPKDVGEEKWFESEIRVPSPQQETEERRLRTRVSELEQRMTWRPSVQAAYADWLKAVAKGPVWKTVKPTSATSKNGSTLTIGEDGVIMGSGKLPETDDYELALNLPEAAEGIRIEALPDDSLNNHGPGRAPNGNFVLSEVYGIYHPYTPHCGIGVKARPSEAVADYDQRDYGAERLLRPDPNFGWAIDGALGRAHEVVLDMRVPSKKLYILHLAQNWPGGKHLLGKFRISITPTENPASLYLPPAVRGWLGNSQMESKLRDYFLKVTPLLAETRADLAEARDKLSKLEAAIPTALIMRDKPHTGPLTAYVHSRGEFLSKTELVEAGYPAILTGTRASSSLRSDQDGRAPNEADVPGTRASSSLRSDQDGRAPNEADIPGTRASSSPQSDQDGRAPVNRLDRAKWIVSRDNPLAARVEVNRLWEQFFGRGIVETSEDFGTQGSRPSHPELLDWLACEFMDKGWDMKAMVRLIVTSATYRQSSNATAALMARDPQNILLARGPRFRLDAETIRDSALAASGLLDTKIGGPSVFPYQPDGVWDNPFSNERWPESKNGDQYRRGLYTFLKRTAPYPSFLNFDSTSRESCVVRRIRTNTPLQALAMLNDKAIFDAAKALGERAMKEGGSTADKRLTYAFRLCTGRSPSKAELTRLDQLLAKLMARYTKDRASAKKLAGTPQKAAWAMVGNVLLNLDETVTKE